jgi:hypothetical protein
MYLALILLIKMFIHLQNYLFYIYVIYYLIN